MKHLLITARRVAVAALLAALLCATGAAAGPVVLVKDIDAYAQPIDSDPSLFAEAGDSVYFVAGNAANGRELWKAGRSGGATLVRDIEPGYEDSRITLMAGAGDRLVFSASPTTYPAGLWSSDGTAAGTRHIRSIAVHGMGSLGETVVFASNAALWRTDGTAEGTQLLRQFSGLATSFTPYNERLFFIATDSVSGREVWSTDGTATGTQMLREITPGAATPGMHTPLVSGGRLVFRLSNQLWASDGTPAGTVMLASHSGQLRGGPALVGGRVLYIMEEFDVITARNWLWSSDGTPAGTTRLVEVTPTAQSHALVSAGGRAFFTMSRSGTHELWTSDGTAAGTAALTAMAGVSGLHAVGDRLFFTADQARYPGELWTSDGTLAGTIPLGPQLGSVLVADDGLFYFSGNGGDGAVPWNGAGFEPWRSDGTPEGTTQIANIAADNPGSLQEHALRPVTARGQVFFTPYVTSAGLAIWRSNGSAAGTREVRRIRYDNLEGAPANLTAAGRLVFFTASEPPPNSIGLSRQLWRTDGTAAGTRLLRIFNPQGNALGTVSGMTAVGGRLFFSAEDEQYGRELWVSDGTPAGTRMVKDIAPGRPSGGAGSITALGGRVFFTTANGDGTSRLWASDGSEAGTQVVTSLEGSGHRIDQMMTWRGRLLFLTSSSAGRGLWQSDGTAAGTTMFALLNVSSIVNLTLSGDRLFFRAETAEAGRELWTSDGTAAGSRLVKDIWPGPDDGGPIQLTAGRSGEVLFAANDGQRGYELWRSDGTEGGTRLVAELNPGPTGAFVSNSSIAAALPAGQVVFAAYTPQAGIELWKSDGTAAGTRMLSDLAPGAASSNPRWLSRAGNALFFAADDNRVGRELWAIAGLGRRPGIILR